MAKIKKIKKVKKTPPVMSHKIHTTKIRKPTSPNKKVGWKDKIKQALKLTVKEHYQNIKKLTAFYLKGVTIKTALKYSSKKDIQRAKEQLKAVAPRAVSKEGVFVFKVKASGLYQDNQYGVALDRKAEFHQVNLFWDLEPFTGLDKSPKWLFENAPIKFECSCGRHTFFYRYLWTRINSALGKQEYRYPKRNNANLSGMFCKHGIRTITVLRGSAFQKTFKRYVENWEQGKVTRLSKKDKSVGTLQSYLEFK
jgi:hypothetical protein